MGYTASMRGNQYHLLGFIPATEAWEMPPALEGLAQRLVASGKLRVNADTERNFVRLDTQTFSTRELADPALRAATTARLARHVAPAAGTQGVEDVLAHLRAEHKKARGISAEKELRVARVLVQAAEPCVIQLLLQSGTEIFVSYSHNVADLMAVHEWEGNGTANGMQATEDSGTAVYVSAGGDPFFEGEHKTYTTDGFPALARMVVISGQELGHFADLRRTPRGIAGRHSTDPNASLLRAHPRARDGRLADMQQVKTLERQLLDCGLTRLRWAEKGVAFYHAKRRFSPPWLFYQLARGFYWALLVMRTKQRGIHLTFKVFPYHRHGDSWALFLADMAFNLAPDAEAYRHPDPLVEEAIAVIEAVARVPQQLHKWGHAAVKLAWPQLYGFYFNGIIPACSQAAGGTMQAVNMHALQRLKSSIRRRVRAKPGYYP